MQFPQVLTLVTGAVLVLGGAAVVALAAASAVRARREAPARRHVRADATAVHALSIVAGVAMAILGVWLAGWW